MYTAQIIIGLFCIFVVIPTFSEADLRADLGEFAALIPRRRVGYIAAQHYILDARFRTSVGFVRDPEFQRTWQNIRETKEFRSIVSHLTEAGALYDATHLIDQIAQRLRTFHIASKVPVEMMFARDLNTFLKDVVGVLPKARIMTLMKNKVRQGGEFAQLYGSLRGKEFRQLLDQARNSSNLAAPIQKLQKHYINVDDLIDLGYSLLEWGPAI